MTAGSFQREEVDDPKIDPSEREFGPSGISLSTYRFPTGWFIVGFASDLVWAFAAADPATQVVAHGAVLLPIALVAAVAFVLRERRASDPVLPLAALRPTGAWGALLVNLLVGVALVAALVDIPLFARNTTTPGDQLGAAPSPRAWWRPGAWRWPAPRSSS